jgi:hypothetical protein
MIRPFSIAMLVAFGAVAFGDSSAEAGKGGGGGGGHSSSNQSMSANHSLNSNYSPSLKVLSKNSSMEHKNDGPPRYMGGSSPGTAANGTPGNLFSKDRSCDDHRDHGDHCDHDKDKCKDPPGIVVDPVHPVNTIHPILSPIVRDHRGTGTGAPSGGVTVMGDPVVRDHRGTGTGTTSGGVTTLGDPVVRDHRGNTAGGVVNSGSPIARDHRGTGATTIVFNGSTLPITRAFTGNWHKSRGNQTVANSTTPVGEALQGLGDALGDAFGAIFDPGFTGPPVKQN